MFGWFLRWAPHAVAHGTNPLFSHAANLPDGVNLTWNTSMPLAALLLSPVTLLVGPTAAYNLLLAGCLAGNLLAAFALARRLCATSAGAYVAAWLISTCPFVAGHAYGHPNLAFVGYPLLVGTLLLDLLRGSRPPRRTGLLLGALTVAQLFTGLEMIAMTAIALLILLCWSLIARRADVRAVAPRVAGSVAVALLAAAPVLLSFGAMFLRGPQRLTMTLPTRGLYDIDLLNIVSSTAAQNPSVFRRLGSEGLSGNLLETTGFVAPLVLLAAYVHRRWRAHDAGVPLLVLAGTTLALSLGTVVRFDEERVPVPGLWRVVRHLPLLENALPGRLTLFPAFALALLIGIGMPSRASAVSGRAVFVALRLCVVALLVIAVAPRLPLPSERVAPYPPGVFRAGDVVEVARHPVFDPVVMLWQAEDDFTWSLYDAYLLTPEFHEFALHSTLRVPCLSGRAPEDCPADLAESLDAAGITLVIAQPGPLQEEYVARVGAALGPPATSGGVRYWRVADPPRGTP